MKNKLIALFFGIILIISFVCAPLAVAAQSTDDEHVKKQILETIDGIIEWKKRTMGIASDRPLLNNEFLLNAGDASGDWYPIGIGRSGYPDDYESYLAVIRDVVQKRYQTDELLSDTKATEWHRISLAILAMGGDPVNAGTDSKGNPINLIADGTYNRGYNVSLGKQGINGWIWGLITLDSMRYEIPDDAYYTREDIIVEILRNQLPDGGFSLNGKEADADMTAMAIQALAPYYNSEETYEYKQRATNEHVEKSVREAVDEALDTLSQIQLDSGDFSSWGIANAESTAQVMVALTALGINPLEDERFIKNGNNLLDVILQYAMDDGGFIHSEKFDPENPSALPDESNTMASEQVLYALVALYRYLENFRSLYDFREEMDSALKEKIAELQDAIDDIPNDLTAADRPVVEDLFATYLTIPIEERSYVFNYYKLADAMEALGIPNTSEPIAPNIGINNGGNGTIISFFEEDVNHDKTIFTEADAEAVTSLPDEMTTEHYVEVIKLMERLDRAENKEEFEHLLDDLAAKKEKIKEIEAEIAAINQLIIEHLYPIDEIGIEDKATVEEIIARYEALSEYDQKKIQGIDDVNRALTDINNTIRAYYISGTLAVIAVALSIILVIRARKRKFNKLKQKMLLEDQ